MLLQYLKICKRLTEKKIGNVTKYKQNNSFFIVVKAIAIEKTRKNSI